MNKVIYKLRLDGTGKCSKNIWLSFLAVLILISVNYRALVMPLWLIISFSVGLLAFSFASFVGFVYWMVRSWNAYSVGSRVQKLSYLVLLGILNVLSFYILLKVMSHPGG